MGELAGLEMEPVALKGKQADLGGIFCVINCWSNDSHRGRWEVFLQRALLSQRAPYFPISFLLFLLSNVQEMSEERGAFCVK